MPTTFQDYYATLGVAKTANAKAIKSAFRKIARESHPDTHPNDKAAEARFRAANEAYEVLGDPEKRKKYDDLGPQWQEYEQWEKSGRPGNNPFGNAGPGFRYQHTSTDPFGEGGVDSFSDFFQVVFGDRGGYATARRGAPRARRGEDLEATTDVTLEEAYTGTTRTIEMTGAHGTRRVEVQVPPGIRDGARIRARGQAGKGTNGGADGDLYVRVHVIPHQRFTRLGDDLYTTVSVPLATAIAGGVVKVPTIGGKNVELTVPPATRNGSRLRLRGQGMPVSGDGSGQGDLIVTVDLQLPSPIPDELQKWAENNRL